MAWNPSPKIADCRDIARKWNCQQVIIIGVDQVNGKFTTSSYGETKSICDRAGKALDIICDQIAKGKIPL